MKKKAIAYKIRNKNSGLYAISVSRNKWGKTGRTWSRMCDVIRVINNGIRKTQKTYGISANKEVISKEIMKWEIVELVEQDSHSTMYHLDRLKL